MDSKSENKFEKKTKTTDPYESLQDQSKNPQEYE